MMSLINLHRTLSQILIQKTNYFFQNHWRDRNHIFVQSNRSSIERKLFWKVISDQCFFYLSEQFFQSLFFDKQWFRRLHKSVIKFELLNSTQIELQCWVELRRVNSTRSSWVQFSTQFDQFNELIQTQWHV